MTVREMREEVLKRRPNFKKVLDVWGEKTLIEYFTQNFENLGTPSEDFLNALHIETKILFGEKIALETVATMNEKRWVNTADHHGLLCHPYFYATALARSHASVLGASTVTLTLPFSSVSLSNDSFPRGLFFHDLHGTVQKIFFKSLNDRRMPVYALPAITKKEYAYAVRNVHTYALEAKSKERLEAFLDAVRDGEQIWNQTSYAAQLTIMNAVLWKTLFGDLRGDFVYLPIENIVVRLLLEKHLVKETPLHKVLFEKEWREAFISRIYGTEPEHKGTEFFWYIDYAKKMSRPLVVDGDTLTTKERDVTITLTPESIANGLQAKTLMPGTALMMILLQGEEGVACGGGPNQLEYLDAYTRAWSTLCAKNGVTVKIPNTQILSESTPLFHTKNHQGHSEPGSLFDMLLYGEQNYSDQVDTGLSHITMSDAFNTLAPTYHYMYTKKKILITETVNTVYLDTTL